MKILERPLTIEQDSIASYLAYPQRVERGLERVPGLRFCLFNRTALGTADIGGSGRTPRLSG